MVKVARLDDAAKIELRRAFGHEDGEIVIHQVNDILGRYPAFDCAGKTDKASGKTLPLKPQNKAALDKANKARACIEKAMDLLSNIEEQHPAIHQSITDMFLTTLSLKLQQDKAVGGMIDSQLDKERLKLLSGKSKDGTLLSNEFDELTWLKELSQKERGQRLTTVSPFMECESLQMLQVMRTMKRALHVSFFQGEWSNGPRVSTENLYQDLNNYWKYIQPFKKETLDFGGFLECIGLTYKGFQRDYKKPGQKAKK